MLNDRFTPRRFLKLCLLVVRLALIIHFYICATIVFFQHRGVYASTAIEAFFCCNTKKKKKTDTSLAFLASFPFTNTMYIPHSTCPDVQISHFYQGIDMYNSFNASVDTSTLAQYIIFYFFIWL